MFCCAAWAALAGASGSLPARGEDAPQAELQAGDGATVNDFANLSLEDLMNVEVTSVSKQRQRVADAPAAVFVISADDIRRSGLTSIPELLRMVPGLQVAQLSASQWAI